MLVLLNYIKIMLAQSTKAYAKLLFEKKRETFKEIWSNLWKALPPHQGELKRTAFCVPLPILTYVTYCNLWVAKSGMVRNYLMN